MTAPPPGPHRCAPDEIDGPFVRRQPQPEILDHDAITIGNLYRKARASVADSVRYLIEAGQRLAKKKDELGHGNWLPWLEANAEVLGFDDDSTARRLMKAGANRALAHDFNEDQALQISREIWGHNVRGTQGTGENEWFTPAEYIELARAVLGEIDLDPATHEKAQELIRATNYFTKADNGLDKEWHGRVWLNPPYAQPLIAQFAGKMIEELRAGHVTAAIMLTHNYTDTEWFQSLEKLAGPICFTHGRVKFYEPDGTTAQPTQGQAFFYFGPHARTFAEKFRPIGFVR
jgi:phage N-6-adenine-methyltransferase